MSKREKLLNKLKTLPSGFSFQQFELILKYYWFKKIKTNAWSHMKWRNSSKSITYIAPKKSPMKIIYLKQLLEIIETHFINNSYEI